MSDPAEAAANRAAMGVAERIYYHHMLDAAREALKPVRALHQTNDYFNRDDGSYEFTCAHCDVLWPCETAKLIYSTEELGQ